MDVFGTVEMFVRGQYWPVRQEYSQEGPNTRPSDVLSGKCADDAARLARTISQLEIDFSLLLVYTNVLICLHSTMTW